MESKKINQLATELTPALSDLTIIGDPTTGISKKITLSQMASLFTGTVEEYPNLAAFPLVGVADTIYIALDTNVLYRWDTGLTSYVELSPNIINSLVFSDANGFDGTISLVGSVATLTITTALTTGSVAFIGASGALSQDNANYFWDNTNKRLGINTNAPTTAIDVFGSGIIGRLNGTSTNNAFLGFASAGSNKWSIGNVQSDHRFRIYNEATTSELVSVLSTGEFGIGIANPTTKLHIDGGASALIANLDANVSVAKSISFRSDNSNRINLEVSGTESGSNAGADFFIRRYSDAGALINTPLTIVRSTGNIGLGITNPTYLFHAYTTEASNARLYLQGTTNFVTTQLGNTSGAFYMAIDSSTGGGFSTESYARLLYSTGAYPLITYVNGSERMRITSSGFIGININNPSAILTVATPSGASEVLRLICADTIGDGYISWFRTTGIRKSFLGYGGSNDDNFYIAQEENAPLVFLTNGTDRMRILAGGNIQAENLFISARQSYKNQTVYYGISSINVSAVTSYTVNLATLFPEVGVNGNALAVYGKYAIYRGGQAESGFFGMSRNTGNTWTSGSFSNQTATGAYSLSNVTGSTNSITFNFNTTVYFACEITCLIS